jgi:transposase InsO family protein
VQVASTHDEKKFVREVIIDIFTLEGNSTLSVVDRDTRYVAAIFLATVTAESVWQTMLQSWSLRYLGHPFVIRHDQGTPFTAVGFQKWAGEAGITCHPVATEQTNSLGIGERIHSPLRRTYLKLRQEHPNMSKGLLLDAAVKPTMIPQV